MLKTKNISALLFSLTLLSQAVLSNFCHADENEETPSDREPASNYRPRRLQKPIAPLQSGAVQPPPAGAPIYVPVPVYIQAPPPPPKKSKPLVGWVISGLLGYDMGSSGNQSIENLDFGLTVGYALNPVWTVGISATMTDATPGDPALANGASPFLYLTTAMLDYHFPGLESLYVGLRIGAGIRSSTFSTPLAGTTTTIGLAYGGFTGWNFQLSDALGLSPQFGMIRAATQVPITDMQIQLAIRYWPYH